MRHEHLRVLVEDEQVWALFLDLAQDFARAQVPHDVMQALRLGRMTALRKKEDEVRGIVAGSVLLLSQDGAGGAWLRAIPLERVFEMRRCDSRWR